MTRPAPPSPCPLPGERGSVILISIVLVFVMTLLGLALFELGAIESRMSLSSAADARAFEVAQAGIERALRELQDGFIADEIIVGGVASWADNDGLRAPICSPSCVVGVYQPITLANTSFPGGGTYSVELMLVRVSEANSNSTYPIGLNCTPHVTPVVANTPCADLVFVRSTGTVSDAPGVASPAPAGYTATRTIQTLVRAASPSVLTNGLVVGAPTVAGASTINGAGLVAGSITVLGASAAGLPAVSWTVAQAGQRNSWAGLDTVTLDRLSVPSGLAPFDPQAVCLVPPAPCAAAGDRYYSLGAVLKIARPTSDPAVVISNGATAGSTAVSSVAFTVSPRNGKTNLDAVFVADGCQTSSCSDSYAVSGGASVPYVDLGAIGRAFPDYPLRTFPVVSATGGTAVRIGGTTYSSLESYFLARAANFTINGGPGFNGVNGIGGANGLRASQSGSFVSPTNSVVQFRSLSFLNRWGQMMWGKICWDTTTDTLTFKVQPGAAAAPNMLVNTGVIIDPNNDQCRISATNATPDNPLLAYMTTGFKFDDSSADPATSIIYRGSAVFFSTVSVTIDEATRSSAATKFPDNNMLTIITPGTVSIGTVQANVGVVMGYFLAGTDFVAQSRTSATRVVGGVAARSRFCLGGTTGCPGSTTNVPEFYQALGDVRRFPDEVLALAPIVSAGQAPKLWEAVSVPRLWLECRPGPLPTTPTGVCGYN
jgi:hypothetical protein